MPIAFGDAAARKTPLQLTGSRLLVRPTFDQAGTAPDSHAMKTMTNRLLSLRASLAFRFAAIAHAATFAVLVAGVGAACGCIDAVEEPPAGAEAGYDGDLSDQPPAYDPDLNGDEGDGPIMEGKPVGWDPDDRVNKAAIEEIAIDKAALKEAEPVAGGELNKFFPNEADLKDAGYDLVFKQEKDGFAMASITKDDAELANVSITDMRSNPDGTDKFLKSVDRVGSHPVVASGSKGTAVLVGGRFQVQVRERENFDRRNRAALLEQFDLDGLEALTE